MSTTLTKTTLCDRCGEAPGAYRDLSAPRHGNWLYCERCVQYDGAHQRGERHATVGLLGHVIHGLKLNGCSDAQVIAAVSDILGNLDGVGCAPSPGERAVLPTGDLLSYGDKPWLDFYEPVEAAR